jgi:hypothetical protein
MKKPEISFRVFGGSGPLSIYWTDGPYGDAVDSLSGRGIAWLAPNGDTLGVEFDDVLVESDHQELKLSNGEKITIAVKKGKVTVHRTRIIKSRSHKSRTIKQVG